MKAVLLLLALLSFTGSEAQYLDASVVKELPLHLLKKEDKFTILNNKVFALRYSLFGKHMVFRSNIENSETDSFEIEGKILEGKDVFVDVTALNDSVLYILTTKKVHRVHLHPHVTSTFQFVSEVPKGNLFTRVIINDARQLLLASFFCADPGRESKIRIVNLSTGKEYRNTVVADPFAFYGSYHLIDYLEGQWVVVPDNLDNHVLFLDDELKETGKMQVLHSPPMDVKTKEQFQYMFKKFRLKSNSIDLDKLLDVLDTLPVIEKVFLLNEGKLLVFGVDIIRDSLLPFVRIYTLNKSHEILSEVEVKYVFANNEMTKPFNSSHVPLNLFGKKVAKSKNRVVTFQRAVNSANLRTNSDYLQFIQTPMEFKGLTVYGINF